MTKLIRQGTPFIPGGRASGGASYVVYNMAEIVKAPIVPLLAYTGIIRRTDLVNVSEFPATVGYSGAVSAKKWMDDNMPLPPGCGIGMNLSTGE